MGIGNNNLRQVTIYFMVDNRRRGNLADTRDVFMAIKIWSLQSNKQLCCFDFATIRANAVKHDITRFSRH